MGALLVCFDPGFLLSGRRTSSFQCWGCWSTSEPRLMQKGPLHLQHWWQGSCLSWRVKGTAAIANRELWQKHGTEHLGPWKQWKSACSVGSRQFLPLNWQGAHRWQKLQTDQTSRRWEGCVKPGKCQPGSLTNIILFLDSQIFGGKAVTAPWGITTLPGQCPALVSLSSPLVPLVNPAQSVVGQELGWLLQWPSGSCLQPWELSSQSEGLSLCLVLNVWLSAALPLSLRTQHLSGLSLGSGHSPDCI